MFRKPCMKVNANATNQQLPLANEVWGKVMFLHLSVSHSVHGKGYLPLGLRGVHPTGHTHPPMVELAIEADGTHPTGMHSCFYIILICDMA